MKYPRLRIGRLMFGVAMLAIPFGLLQSVVTGHSLTGEVGTADLGLWPGLVAFGTASFVIAGRRGKGSPFLWGFATAGWISVLAYVACCRWLPDVAQIPIRFCTNELDAWWLIWLLGSDDMLLFLLNLLVMGSILAAPQLILATVAGLVTRWAWRLRWTSTCSSRAAG